MEEYSYGTLHDTLVVGGGPSTLEYIEFIKDWKGAIVATDVTMKHLLRYGIKPMFVCIHEAINRNWRRDFTPEVMEYMKRHYLVIEDRKCGFNGNMIPSAGLIKVKTGAFNQFSPNKINNVGLLAIVFCHVWLKLKHCHLIGMENTGESLAGGEFICPEADKLLSIWFDLYPFMKIINWSPNHAYTDPRIITSDIPKKYKKDRWLNVSQDFWHSLEYPETEHSISLKN